MSQNCAFLLADLLDRYEVPASTTPEAHRGFKRGIHNLEAWRAMGAAADLVRAVDNTLIGMEAAGTDTAIYTASLPHWYAGIYMATNPWGSNRQNQGPRPACAAADIRMLRALGGLLDAHGALTIDEASRRSFADTLEEARTILTEDLEVYPTDIRHYLLSLLTRAQTVIDSIDTYGPEALRQVALELGGALYLRADAVEQTDPPRAGRMRTAAGMLVGGFMSKFGQHGADTAIATGAAAAAKIIGG